MEKTELTYDQALARIEEIVGLLEDGNKGMDELSALVIEAASLVNYCKARLRMTEEEISKAFEEKKGD
jgi:exodeoxyribonuclease VII small subunit